MAAPILPATLSLNFGIDTGTGAGGYELSRSNTGGAITGGFGTNALTGTNNSHFQIDAAGVITVSAAGRAAALASGPYSLTATVYSADASETAALTITIEPNTLTIGVVTTAGSVMPTPYTQLLNTLYSGLSANYVSYKGTTSARTIKYRPDVIITPWSNNFFRGDNNNTAIISHVAEDFDNPPEYRAAETGPGTYAVAANRRFYPVNHNFEGIKWVIPYLRASERVGESSVGSGMNGYPIGDVRFYRNIFSTSTIAEIGHGMAYKGPFLALNRNDGLAHSLTIDECSWEGLWMRAYNFLLYSYTTSLTVVNNHISGFFSDGLQVNGGVSNVLIDNNTLDQATTDTYRVGFNSAGANMSRAGGMTGGANGTKALLVLQVHDFTANGTILTYGGITVAIASFVAGSTKSASLVVTVRTPGAATILTMTSATPILRGCRSSILISIDTEATSRLYIRREEDFGAGSWVQDATATAAGETINLTGAVTYGFYTLYAAACLVFEGVAPDITDSGVRTTIFGSIGHMTETTFAAARAAYDTASQLKLAVFDYWLRLVVTATSNRGSGGDLTKVGTVEAAHGDLIQFAPLANVSNITITNNTCVGDNGNTEEGGRYNFKSFQGIFLEDVANPSTNWNYTNVTISGNIVISSTTQGVSLFNSINGLIENNTLLAPYGIGGSIPIGVQQHYSGTGSGNIVRSNVLTGTIGIRTGWGTENNNLASTLDASWASYFVGDGGSWALTTGALARAALARKPGGALATGDIGANPAGDAPATPPANTIAPVASPGGDGAYTGNQVSVTTGTWTNSPSSYTYQWRDGAGSIAAATASTYTLVAGDVGEDIYCRVTATNASGSASADSNTVTVLATPTYEAVNDLFELAYNTVGNIAVLANDVLLDDVTGITGGDPLCTAVVEANNTITVTPAQNFSGTVEFTVSLTGNSGAVSRTSTLTVTVAASKTFTITTS